MGGRHQGEDARGNHWSPVRLRLSISRPASMQDDTEEETDYGSSEENLDQRLQMLERKIEKNNRSNYEFTKALNEVWW